MPRHSTKPLDRPSIFAAGLLVAIGGLIYELILGTAASYLFGDSIISFSIATGVSLFGMGIGSLLSQKLIKNAGLNFARNEIILGLLGGNSVILLFAAYSMTPIYWLVFILLSVLIGIGIGIEIPLLVNLLRSSSKKETEKILGRVLALDYFGALIASLIFPFVLLPYLGIVRTAYAVALLNLLIAVYILHRLKISRKQLSLAWMTIFVLLGFFIFSTRIESAINARAFQDPVVFYTNSQYQRIVITKFQHDTRLYLNSQLQFSSIDEQRYHETLAHSALSSVTKPNHVLVLGGGDGMLVREVLKYPSVEHITLIDIDPAMTNLAKSNRLLAELNKNSLSSPKVDIKNLDAFSYLSEDNSLYDAILIDLVDPANERTSKLYSLEFYRTALSRLSDKGVLVTQATSSYFTPNSFSIISSTLKEAARSRTVTPIYTNIPSFGEWGFAISTPTSRLFYQDLPDDLHWQSLDKLRSSVVSIDMSEKPNALLHPTLYRMYQSDMNKWRY